jgi:hypothetical protein
MVILQLNWLAAQILVTLYYWLWVIVIVGVYVLWIEDERSLNFEDARVLIKVKRDYELCLFTQY